MTNLLLLIIICILVPPIGFFLLGLAGLGTVLWIIYLIFGPGMTALGRWLTEVH